ncbi:unnamed protein product [Bursaphelenchus okinawaensis]|uniref:Uncharacterized protein n=1 Tax=Bursaphelenchus okinawaensis TaxID=465554 RepID=A0A811LP30_9BILA|nr:unnamed protein product [Bursaphelenchus okinawaensis]CAG9125127.1 unnamed protein product [Bursaphelenchus okinawaensis]
MHPVQAPTSSSTGQQGPSTPVHNAPRGDPHNFPPTPQRANPPQPAMEFTMQQMAEKRLKLKELYGKYAQKPLPPTALQSVYTAVPTNSSLNNDFLVVMPRLDIDETGPPQMIPPLGNVPIVRESFAMRMRPR